MKHVPDPSWSFEELITNAWKAYIGGGIESRGRRNNMIRTWARMVGRERALFEFDNFVRTEGGFNSAADTVGVAPSGLKSLRREIDKMSETPLSPRAPSLRIGQVLKGGRLTYTVTRRIGAGGVGQVYEVDGSDGVHYAAKILSTDRFEITSSVRARFRRESEIASEFQNPNVVRSIELLQQGPDLINVMEYLDGPLLLDALRQNRPSFTQALDWMQQLADGLAYLHSQDIVHRDLSAKNAIFRAYPKALALCDFGVSRRTTDATVTSATERMGSLIYISPQQKEDPHSTQPADDVYALGQLFFFLLTGREPHGMPANPKQIEITCPIELGLLIARMRSHQRADRPRDGRAVVMEINSLQGFITRGPDQLNIPDGWQFESGGSETLQVRRGELVGITPRFAHQNDRYECPSCRRHGPWSGVRCLTCGRNNFD